MFIFLLSKCTLSFEFAVTTTSVPSSELTMAVSLAVGIVVVVTIVVMVAVLLVFCVWRNSSNGSIVLQFNKENKYES